MGSIYIDTKPSASAATAERVLQTALAKHPVEQEQTLVFAIGGDGTLLAAIRQHLKEDALFIGISAGTLGFLQTIREEQIPSLVTALHDKSYSVLKAPLLVAEYADGTVLGHAFNDISIERQGPQAVKFDVHINHSVGSFIGDGVIFSTPLGSTAYSLAAGGPIVDSLLADGFVVTPNNPHFSALYSSLQRPHLLHTSRVVHVTLDHQALATRPVRLMIDGHAAVEQLDQDVQIRMSEQTVQLLQLNDDALHDQIELKRLGRG